MLSLALCLFCFGALAYADPYVVPKAHIEVFRPRGLRISIPDNQGIKHFSVHAVVNKAMNELVPEDISQYILKKSRGRWVYENKKIKLNYGDVINYWVFVVKGNLGYRLDDQTFSVTEFQDPSHTETIDSSQYVPVEPLPSFACDCRSPTSPPPCAAPTSHLPPPQSALADIAIFRELIVNTSKENENLRQQISVLFENNEIMLSKLQRLGDENLLKLRLEGEVLLDTNPIDLIKTILMEKLKIFDTVIVKNAVRNFDGTITFSFRSIDDKLRVLRAAKEKLKGAKFSIKDI